VSVLSLDGKKVDDLYIVTATGKDKTGRCDAATGAVPLKGLTGDNLANAIMKAETKAKRRLTLSLCGLGMLDDSEVESVPGAKRVDEPNISVMEKAAKAAPYETAAVPPPAEVKPEPVAAEVVPQELDADDRLLADLKDAFGECHSEAEVNAIWTAFKTKNATNGKVLTKGLALKNAKKAEVSK
jgi:hypothetical protein